MTRPPPPWLPPRYLASIGPYAVKYVAACPHGRDTGTTSRSLCGCDCEEAA
jgi:hypothetical protein